MQNSVSKSRITPWERKRADDELERKRKGNDACSFYPTDVIPLCHSEYDMIRLQVTNSGLDARNERMTM